MAGWHKTGQGTPGKQRALRAMCFEVRWGVQTKGSPRCVGPSAPDVKQGVNIRSCAGTGGPPPAAACLHASGAGPAGAPGTVGGAPAAAAAACRVGVWRPAVSRSSCSRHCALAGWHAAAIAHLSSVQGACSSATTRSRAAADRCMSAARRAAGVARQSAAAARGCGPATLRLSEARLVPARGHRPWRVTTRRFLRHGARGPQPRSAGRPASRLLRRLQPTAGAASCRWRAVRDVAPRRGCGCEAATGGRVGGSA